MEELIQKLQDMHGLSADQSHGILNTITNFVKEKFPMVGGAIDNIFQSGTTPSSPSTTPSDTQSTAATSVSDNASFLDKISDYIPGATGEKIEEFAKSKLGNMFGGNKTV